ncbi:Light-sensor Protein kinase [Agyrium rufum]|nr:Light-sensor Protein kinase [Agyrium rufum]
MEDIGCGEMSSTSRQERPQGDERSQTSGADSRRRITSDASSESNLRMAREIRPVSRDDSTSTRPTTIKTRGGVSPTRVLPGTPFGQLSPSATDRVFPIKSVVSVDSASTPLSRLEGKSYGFPNIAEPESLSRNQSEARYASAGSNRSVGEESDNSLSEGIIGSRRRQYAIPSRPQATTRSSMDATELKKLSPEAERAESDRMGGQRQMSFNGDTASLQSEIGSASGAQSEAASIRSGKSGRNEAEDIGTGILTARFKHVVTDGGHAVITGRGGDALQRCEDEPIHIPGAIQGFGLLIAFAEEAEGKLVVRIVSENSKEIMGYTPRELFELDSFTDILSDEQADNLLDQLDFIRDEECDTATNGPEVFTISIRPPKKRSLKLWCAMHINEANRGLIICEFELEDDHLYPLVPPNEVTPEPPEDTMGSDPTPEELAESTVNTSRPLRVLRSARKRKGEAAAMEVFNIMSQVQEQLANAPDLSAFLKVLVGVVKELTGFHRVMVYQFDQSWNGRVVTELVDPRATKDLYKGLNFPASDIPKQARDLYKINKVRLLYDRDLPSARLVCKATEDLDHPLDLTFSYLRAMSPIHIKYLANMAVRSSMSISINAFDELWGLIACHTYGGKGMRVSFPIRKMCRLVGDSASRNIERLSYASRLQARKLINTAPTESNPSGYIIASSDDLLKLFNADSGLLSIRDETKILGKIEQTQEALALLEYLRLRCISSVMTSSDIRVDFPDIRYGPGFSAIAGLLLVPLSASGKDFIVFFRKGQLREVKWAGNPYEKFVKEGTEGYLEPRKSFKTWSETIAGKCMPWTEEEIETAAVLCLVYGKFIEVWRQKEQALQNSQLTRLLLANSAHEVRTPLNAIINYLEIAMEGSLDQETRDNLSKSHSASKSLIYVINDLLDLTKTEEGHDLVKADVFDLRATVKEATDIFRGDAKRKQIDYETVEYAGVPQMVLGDQRRVRQAISNVTANAIQSTTSGFVKIETWLVERTENHAEVEIVVSDTGVGMSPARIDALFRELEQVQSEGDAGLEEKLASVTPQIGDADQAKRALGLGLAVVARIVRILNGHLRLKSEEGKGSRFVIQLGFNLPPENPATQVAEGGGLDVNDSMSQANQPITPPVPEGELTLIKSAQKAAGKAFSKSSSGHRLSRRTSADSATSATSLRSFKSGSSGKSDVDRLIDALQEPHLVGSVVSAGGETHVSRSASISSRQDTRSTRSAGSASRRSVAEAGEIAPANLVKQDSMGSRIETSGEATITDTQTPIKPIRVADGGVQGNAAVEYDSTRPSNRVLFDIPQKSSADLGDVGEASADTLRVLVAEDDPINSKIIKKRLGKLGHEVYLTINGEECAHVYAEKASTFDVVLMDMQMPIVDGLTSTKMIRSHEKTTNDEILSRRAALNGRTPIFAVSASLIEKDLQQYIDAGFDGWILKPIDFKRLSVLLLGIVDVNTRISCLYKPGSWEAGGWFEKDQRDVFNADTTPNANAVVHSKGPKSISPQQEDPITEEQDRLETLDNDAVHADPTPQDPGSSGHLDASGSSALS